MSQNLLTTINIGSENALVLSGKTPLPETMLTQIYITVWRHLAAVSLINMAVGLL